MRILTGWFLPATLASFLVHALSERVELPHGQAVDLAW